MSLDESGQNHLIAKEADELPIVPGVEMAGVIASGGMGKLYWGTQPFLDRPVAVKLFGSCPTEKKELFERFQLEAKILATLDHPNIVHCYQAGATVAHVPYIVMEMVSGPSLGEYLRTKGPLEEVIALQIIRELAQALEYALGKGIIHRDVKPDNVLLSPTEQLSDHGPFAYRAKLADLGLAKYEGNFSGAEDPLKDYQVVGTPTFMAPEQHDRSNTADHRADIFALGGVLYCMLTAHHAFSGDNARQLLDRKIHQPAPSPLRIVPSLHPMTDRLTRRMMAADREKRHRTYEELIQECDRVLAQLRAMQLPQRGTPQRKLLMIGMGGIILALAGVAAFSVFELYTESPREIRAPDLNLSPTPAANTDMVSFSPVGLPLFQEDPSDRLRGWQHRSGTAAWLNAETGVAVVVHATGEAEAVAAYPLGRETWRLGLEMELIDGEEAGLLIDMENGDMLRVGMHREAENLLVGADYLSTQARDFEGISQQMPRRGTTLQVNYDGDLMSVESAGATVFSGAIDGRPVSLGLFCRKGKARFAEARLFSARPAAE